jgi:hypothetical protein
MCVVLNIHEMKQSHKNMYAGGGGWGGGGGEDWKRPKMYIFLFLSFPLHKNSQRNIKENVFHFFDSVRVSQITPLELPAVRLFAILHNTYRTFAQTFQTYWAYTSIRVIGFFPVLIWWFWSKTYSQILIQARWSSLLKLLWPRRSLGRNS